jgi:hypothetical protein
MNRQDTILQHWLAAVVTTPGSLQHKLQAAENNYGLTEHDVVSSEGTASVYERLHVYSSGYVLRLLDCLCADFPVLRRFVGADVFEAFAKASLVYGPPVSYTLYDLGKTFINFLETTRPTRSDERTQPADPLLDLPIEMAKLERARQEALRAPGTEDDSEAAATDINLESILFQGNELRVASPECLRLLELKFPLLSFFHDVSTLDNYSLPAPQKTYVAVSRKNYRITTQELEEWQYHFLLSCREPITLSAAIQATAKASGHSDADLVADLLLWLPVFFDNGFLMHV